MCGGGSRVVRKKRVRLIWAFHILSKERKATASPRKATLIQVSVRDSLILTFCTIRAANLLQPLVEVGTNLVNLQMRTVGSATFCISRRCSLYAFLISHILKHEKTAKNQLFGIQCQCRGYAETFFLVIMHTCINTHTRHIQKYRFLPTSIYSTQEEPIGYINCMISHVILWDTREMPIPGCQEAPGIKKNCSGAALVATKTGKRSMRDATND